MSRGRGDKFERNHKIENVSKPIGHPQFVLFTGTLDNRTLTLFVRLSYHLLPKRNANTTWSKTIYLQNVICKHTAKNLNLLARL